MKAIKYIIFLSIFYFSSMFSMFGIEKFPEDVLVVVCEFLIEEKEIDPSKVFVNIDAFRLTSKNFRRITELLVKKAANKEFEKITNQLEKQKALNNYNYLKFKQDLMLNIWSKKIINIVPDDRPKEIIDTVKKLELYMWSRNQVKINKNYQNGLKKELENLCEEQNRTKETFRNNLEQLLKMGVDPNSEINFIQNQFTEKRSQRILSIVYTYKEIDIVKLLLEYGADPNFSITLSEEYQRTLLEMACVGRNNIDESKLFLEEGKIKADPNFVYLVYDERRTVLSHLLFSRNLELSEEIVNLVKLLLKNGADPRIKLSLKFILFPAYEGTILQLYKKFFYVKPTESEKSKGIPDIAQLMKEAANRLDYAELLYSY